MPSPLVAGLAVAVAMAAVFLWNWRDRVGLRRRLRARWGHPAPVRRYPEVIQPFHRWRAEQRDGSMEIDDRTAADLHLDEVFASLDHTLSGIGRQVLYDRLRQGASPADAPLVRRLADLVAEDPAVRERLQLQLVRLEGRGSYDIWRLTVPNAIPIPTLLASVPLVSLGVLASTLALPFVPQAFLALVGLIVGGLLIRASFSWMLRWVLPTVRQLAALLQVARELARMERKDQRLELGIDTHDLAALERLRRIARWAARESDGSGNPLELLRAYFNLVLLTDANVLVFSSRELARRAAPLARMLTAVGTVDVALSIASYRSSVRWARPTIAASDDGAEPGNRDRVELRGIRHPLLEAPVPNDLTVESGHGLVVTGSNMSGKSTYLRTVGVTVLMAQTIETCLAEEYRAPLLRIRSAIGRSDDLLAGKSYYLAEVEAVTELVRQSADPIPTLFLFDELFRGTNAVERIAAGAAVLRELLDASGGPRPHVVLVATHDGELVDLLTGHRYLSVHFEESVGPEGIAFDYLLKPGPARTRNAIALLERQGAPARMIASARILTIDLDRRHAPAPDTPSR